MKQLRMRFKLIALILIGLLAASGAYGVYSVNTYGSRWVNSARNARYRSARSSVIPGDITDRGGIVVATSDENGKRVYQNDMLSRAALVHLIGDSEGNVANGVESFQSSYLLGFQSSLTERISELVDGKAHHGDNITLTADSRLSTRIVQTFRTNSNTKGKCGAAVVMNYKTGEVLALVSLPVYDPTNITSTVKNSPQHPFWNRAVQSTLPPGSTFKIISTICALNHLSEAETRLFTCTGATQVMDHIITDYGNSQHGELTLPKAFRVSCNNTFAQIALMAGDKALRSTAESFGFNDNFLFKDLVVENSTYPTKNRNDFEIAWSGAGQSQITATPLHMCMVASAIANNGVMMEPRVVKKVVSPMGEVRQSFSPKEYRTACSVQDAKTLQKYMRDVVKNGTGTKAQTDGLVICGKTGSAESSLDGRDVTHAWFVGYIDDETLPYACCVLVEEGGSGGSVAAPVAAEIFAWIRDNMR